MTTHESAAAYLLGALTQDEGVEFESHLNECEECREELAHLRMAADALPMAAEQMVPPRALRDRIMTTVQREAELLAAAGPEADRPRQAVSERRRWSFGWRPSYSFASAALAVGLVVGVLASGGFSDQSRTVLANTAPAGAKVELEVRDEHSTLVARGLPAPPTGRVYQVWLKRPGKAPVPTNALFKTRKDGSASVDVSGSLDDVDEVLVTHEPEGGSDAPTSEPLISVSPA